MGLIHEAVVRGKCDDVQRLIEANGSQLLLLQSEEDIQLQDEQHVLSGCTSLFLAARQGDGKMIQCLYELAREGGVSLDAEGQGYWDPVFCACHEGHTEVVIELVHRQNANPTKAQQGGLTALMAAAAKGHLDTIKILLTYIHEKHLMTYLDQRDDNGYTALHYSCRYGRKQVVKALLTAGADPTILLPGTRASIDIVRWRPHPHCSPLIEEAKREPERSRLLHRARSMADARQAISKALKEAEGQTRQEKRLKCLGSVPSYLKGRVKEGDRVLPRVKIGVAGSARKRGGVGGRGETSSSAVILVEAIEYVALSGRLPPELFTELMEMMIPAWDGERRRM